MFLAPKQLQAAVLTGLFTLSGLTVALTVAAQPDRTRDVVDSFILSEQNDVTDPSTPFAGAHFNLRGFMSHPCFVITNAEEELCHDTYGIGQDLKHLMDDGELLALLRDRGLLAAGPATLLPTVAAQTATTSEPVNLGQMVNARRQALWGVCLMKFHARAGMCFQRNIRLLRRYDSPINETSVY